MRVLLVMSSKRHRGLSKLLASLGVEAVSASDKRETLRILENGPGVDAVFVASSVKNACWRDIRTEVRAMQPRTPVVVCMGLEEPGLMDVLEGGGAFGVLVEPYEQQEVQRLLELSAGVNGGSVAAA